MVVVISGEKLCFLQHLEGMYGVITLLNTPGQGHEIEVILSRVGLDLDKFQGPCVCKDACRSPVGSLIQIELPCPWKHLPNYRRVPQGILQTMENPGNWNLGKFKATEGWCVLDLSRILRNEGFGARYVHVVALVLPLNIDT